MEKKSKHLCSSGHLLKSWPVLCLLFLTLSLSAQEFGGNPPSLKWKQINTDTTRIIFPSGLEKQAQDIAGIVHQLASLTRRTIGEQTKKVNIVLQNQTTVSNGYVALGPYRSEFFLTPRQNSFELGSLPWHKTLALHEYRHVQQYNNFRKGLSRAFYYVFGEEGQALANGLAVPDWFFEGDAVYQETMLSNQGRGRIPYFYNGFRSLWAADKNYSWMKLRNGSYRDYVPDHYELGYLLVNYGYQKYGEEAWKKITQEAAAFKGLFYPLQRSFKRNTGERFNDFTKEAINHYKQPAVTKNITDSAAQFGKGNIHFAADESYPQWADATHFIYLKSSYSKIPAFYIRNTQTGEEKKIKNKSISTDTYFSFNNNLIVYSAYHPDARWGWRNFEDIKILDVTSGKERTLTKRTKYQSPDISQDGKQVVAVFSDPNGMYALHLISAETGKLITAIPNPSGYIYTYPKFYDSENIVSAVRNEKGEMALGLFNTQNGDAKWLTPFSYRVIGFPQINKDTVVFSMTAGNQDRLFAAAGGKMFLFRPSSENISTGNYQLSAHNGNYVWTAFTSAGYHIYQGDGRFEEYDESKTLADIPYRISEMDNKFNLVTQSANYHAGIERYPPGYKLFNFHSWRPYISDPDYSYSLISENVLNTLQTELYITYNTNEKYKETGAALAYAGRYPVINGGASFTFDRSFSDSAQRITWNEFNAKVGVSLPLYFTSGIFSQSLSVGGTFNTKQVYYTGASKNLFEDKRFNYGDLIFSFTNQQAKAKQNIYPRIAQTFSARYRRIINKYTANQLLINGGIYLPGILRNHNLVLQGAYQMRDTLQQYNFSNSFPFSRGYPDIDFPRMWKLAANYHFPIAYPDWGFANIVYLLRLRGNLFYDHSEVKSLRTGNQFSFNTTGMELYFDTKWWNQLPVSFGIRYSRLLDADILGISPNQWELVLPLSLLSR